MKYMFYEASAFNYDISSWTGTAATTPQNNIFLGATAFNATYQCASINGPPSSCKQFISILLWDSLGTSLKDDVSGVEIETQSGSIQFDAANNAIVSNGNWVGYVDFTSLRANRNDYIFVNYEVFVPTSSSGFQYSLAVGTDANGDSFSWYNDGDKVCAHVPWGGVSNCVPDKTYASYKGRWVKLAMVRPAEENLVYYYIDGEKVITYTPSNGIDITSHGVLSQLHFFNHPWAGGDHKAASGIKVRNVEVRVLDGTLRR